MIECRDVMLGRGLRGPHLGPASFKLEPGLHALVGGTAAGGPELLRALAGLTRTRGGDARVLGEPARPRPEVIWVGAESALPRSLSVREVLELAGKLRQSNASPTDVLARFGLSALAERRAHTLAAEEAHAVAVAEALGAKARVLLLEEPLVRLDARASAAVVQALRSVNDDPQCTIVIATASVRDARAVGAKLWRVDSGRVSAAPEEGTVKAAGALRIVGPDLRALASALAENPRADAIRWQGADLVVHGADGLALAGAVSACILESSTRIDMLEPAEWSDVNR